MPSACPAVAAEPVVIEELPDWLDWQESSRWDRERGEIHFEMSGRDLSDGDVQRWLVWLSRELHAASPWVTWSIATLDLSYNDLTSDAIERIVEFLRNTKLNCDEWNFEGNHITDDAFIRVAYHISEKVAKKINFSKNKDITTRGLEWLCSILSWHPLYPVKSERRGGAVYSPLVVILDGTGVSEETEAVEAFFHSNQFQYMCCRVNIGCSQRMVGKHNVALQLELGNGICETFGSDEYSMLQLSEDCKVHPKPRMCRLVEIMVSFKDA